MTTSKRDKKLPTVLDYESSTNCIPQSDKAFNAALRRTSIENLNDVFERLGGVAGMFNWAKDNPTEFYKLWAKMIPKEVVTQHTITDGNGQGVNIFITGQMSDAEIEAEFIGGTTIDG